MVSKTNEEIQNLEKQLELLKQKQQIEDENKQLREDVAYLRKSQQEKDDAETKGCMILMGFAILLPIIGTALFMLFFG